MTSPSYRGWVRLGIVLSIVWLIGVSAYAAYDYHLIETDPTRSDNGVYPLPEGFVPDLVPVEGTVEPAPPFPEDFIVVGQQSFFTNCTLNQKTAPKKKIKDDSGRTFVPKDLIPLTEKTGKEAVLEDVPDDLITRICSPRFGNLALLALLPVGVVWLATSLLVVAFLWVRAGFRRET